MNRRRLNKGLRVLAIVMIFVAGSLAGINAGGSEEEQLQMAMGVSLFMMTILAYFSE